MKLGCHVSNSGKEMLVGSVNEAVSYGANCFMVYMGAPQNTYRKKKEDLNITKMQNLLIQHNIDIDDIIVHAPYIINLAQGDEEKRRFAVDFMVREVSLANEAGFKTIVIHPGAHVGQGIEKGMNNIVTSLKEVLDKTSNTSVSIALETMAGKGTEVGSRFTEIKYLIDQIKSPRIKVCLDTCHIHDAGYDIVNHYSDVFSEFNNIIGFDKLAVIHVNDSKNPLGSRKDRHENIGFGHIGFDTLNRVIKDSRFRNIPKILETPYVSINDSKLSLPPYKYEIEMIKKGEFNKNILKQILQN